MEESSLSIFYYRKHSPQSSSGLHSTSGLRCPASSHHLLPLSPLPLAPQARVEPWVCCSQRFLPQPPLPLASRASLPQPHITSRVESWLCCSHHRNKEHKLYSPYHLLSQHTSHSCHLIRTLMFILSIQCRFQLNSLPHTQCMINMY